MNSKKPTTVSKSKRKAINQRALEIAEENVASGNWKQETAQIFVQGVEEQPERFLRFAKRRQPCGG